MNKPINDPPKDQFILYYDTIGNLLWHLDKANQRIKQLEESENRLLNWLTEGCPDSVKNGF